MNDPVQKALEEAAKMGRLPEPVDPFSTPEYEAFVESMIPFCHCARNRPCDGVLAGGLCDDSQDDEGNDIESWAGIQPQGA